MTFKVPEEIKDSATSYKVVYLVRQSTSTPYNQNIRIDSVTLGDTALTAQISNIGDTEIKVIYVTAVFYKDGEVIGAKELGIECNNPGTSTTETFYYPYYMEDVVPDDCKLYINYACSY